MKGKILHLFKEETVLCAALMLAALSMPWVPPDREYLRYVDFRTLSILLCLMGVMSGLQKSGIFGCVAQALLGRVTKAWQLLLILVLLCFFSSMLITNDVALITFVPFTFTVLNMAGPQAKQRLAIPAVALQTVAANLGSMLTPIGNPQNLYLYGKAGLSPAAFMLLMLPYASVSLLLLVIWGAAAAKAYAAPLEISFSEKAKVSGSPAQLAAYGISFLLALLTVARVIPYGATLAATLLILLLADKAVFRHVDYGLLLTFVGFFIFIGNMGRLPAFSHLLQRIVSGNEVLAGVAASQLISNVPAALLLSGFTDRFAGLIIGVNLGGLGTLIASMASLISYKLVVREEGEAKGAYFRYFTLVNVCFLAILLAFARICGG